MSEELQQRDAMERDIRNDCAANVLRRDASIFSVEDVALLLSLLDEARAAHPKIATAGVVAGYMRARDASHSGFEEWMAGAESYAIEYVEARWPTVETREGR